MDKLKPCPWCGQPMQFVCRSYSYGETTYKFSHANKDDDSQCPVIWPIYFDAESVADALNAWDGRCSNDLR